MFLLALGLLFTLSPGLLTILPVSSCPSFGEVHSLSLAGFSADLEGWTWSPGLVRGPGGLSCSGRLCLAWEQQWVRHFYPQVLLTHFNRGGKRESRDRGVILTVLTHFSEHDTRFSGAVRIDRVECWATLMPWENQKTPNLGRKWLPHILELEAPSKEPWDPKLFPVKSLSS